MTDLMELFRHWHAGRSQVQISTALGLDRKTIRKYLTPALAAGLTERPHEIASRPTWRNVTQCQQQAARNASSVRGRVGG